MATLGRRIALAQLLLKLTSPGVPDIYQGDELESLALVDPDNRRPVDWQRRRDALRSLRAGVPPTRDTAKLFTIASLLALRARRPADFGGPYRALPADTTVCAFTRGDAIAVVVPTRPVHAPRPELPDGEWTNVLAPLCDLYEHAPAVYEHA